MARSRTTLAAALAAAALATLPAPAMAGCGGVVTAKAGKKLGDFTNPLIIGDSVLLGAVQATAARGWTVNAHGCRSWAEGAQIIRKKAAARKLPHMVAMFVGADWEISRAQIEETLFRVGPTRVLVLVTPREVGGAGGRDAQNERDAAAAHPGRILLLDWVRYTRHRPSWFAPDGLHLNRPGIPGLAKYLARALKYAAPGSFPGTPPTPAP
jgi:hypothetical protein